MQILSLQKYLQQNFFNYKLNLIFIDFILFKSITFLFTFLFLKIIRFGAISDFNNQVLVKVVFVVAMTATKFKFIIIWWYMKCKYALTVMNAPIGLTW